MKKRKRREKLSAPLTMESVLEHNALAKRATAGRVGALPYSVWRKVVGVRIAERAVPASFEGGVLVLQVATSPWAQELILREQDLRERLAAEGFVVSQVRVRVGPIAAMERPPERKKTRRIPAPVALPPVLGHELANVRDEELRGLLASAAARALAWQEVREGPPMDEPRDRLSAPWPPARGPRDAGTESDRPDRTNSRGSESARRKT